LEVGDARMTVALENGAKSRKNWGVSPVIATVILVAVAITIAVAVSYWMSGISTQYAKFESVDIVSGYCTMTGGNWTLSFILKNSGTSTASLLSIFINDVEIDTYNTTAVAGEWTSDMTSPRTITSGQPISVNVYVSSSKAGSSLSSGTTVNVKFHSAAGMDYISMKELV
jgi:flagellin-like protein